MRSQYALNEPLQCNACFDANKLAVFTMAIAFFLVYPIILLLGSVTVLCDLINRPIEKQKFKRWETRLQSFCFTPLVIAGLVTVILEDWKNRFNEVPRKV